MAIREGRWDCPSCGSTAIYGRHVDCPGCGKPRPAGVRFYLTEAAPVVTDPERLAEARAGRDWACVHCAATNRATLDACGGCGAPRSDAPAQAAAAAPAPEAGRARAPLGRRAWVVGALVVAWIVAAVADEYEPPPRPLKLVPAVVEAVAWEHGVIVEERRLVPDSGRTLSDSAVEVVRGQVLDGHRNEVAGYEMVERQVPRVREYVAGHRTEWQTVAGEGESVTSTTDCGSTDLGNGYFSDSECTETGYVSSRRRVKVRVPIIRADTTYETVTVREPVYREVPVYAPFYRYRRVEWMTVDTVHASGDTAAPWWPAVPEVPGRRAGGQLSRYTVTARDARGGVHQASVSAARWPPHRPGERIAISPASGGLWLASAYPADSLPACRRWHRGRGDPPPASLGCSPRRR